MARERDGESPQGSGGPWPTARDWDDEDRPGDPACWLRRVCPACGTLADADPPTTCPRCHGAIPVP